MDKVPFSRNLSQLFSNIGGNIPWCCRISGLDVRGSNRRVLLGLALLNVVLLVVAVALGSKCAKVKEGSLRSHSAVAQLISELEYLHGNHSDVMLAEQEVRKALETAASDHTRMKTQIERLKSGNEGYQKQVETLRTEKKSLQANISALEGSCGKCVSGWIRFNSSCYFFSYSESATAKKTWPDSRADCVGRGADLIVIDSQEEQKFASDNVEGKETSPHFWENGFWIGLTDTGAEGEWIWINNVTEVENRYWRDGEPNDYGRGEDCGLILPSRFNPWKTRNDQHCDSLLHWICETPSS